MLEFLLWMFVNLMVATGMNFLATYPPEFMDNPPKPGEFHWRHVISTSVMAIFCMIYPYRVPHVPGVQIDLRTIPLGLTGWTHSWTSSVAIGMVIVLARFWIGGAGVPVAALLTVYVIALTPIFKRFPQTPFYLGLMGLSHAAGLYLISQLLLRTESTELGPTSPYWLLLAATFVGATWLVNLAQNYTQRKRELQQKYVSELRTNEALLELIPYGIVFLDAGRNVISCNNAGRQLMNGDQVPQVILDDPEIDQALREHKRISHRRVSFANPLWGSDFQVLVSEVPLPGGGAVLGLENVTPLVRQEREEARRDRLETLGRLAATAAHEIKNPLTTIKGFVQLLATKPEFAPHRSAFTLLQGEADHINRVVSDFLELAGHGGEADSLFPLDELVREVLSAMELQFPDGNVTVRVTGEPSLLLRANHKSVKQILKNLVANAYEAMPSGGSLTVGWERNGDQITVTVADTGPGIAPEMLPMIFTPYMTTKATGTGLGLAISHKLATDMGGRLEVLTGAGTGCLFSLTLMALGQVAAVSAGA